MVSQEYTYAYAAVSVSDGHMDSLILPHVNGECMQVFLDEMAARHLNDRIIMVLDGAGWHKNESLSLPPYSLELNPVEHIWDDLRKRNFTTEFSTVLTPSIQNCFQDFKCLQLLPLNNFGLTLIRKPRFSENDFLDIINTM